MATATGSVSSPVMTVRGVLSAIGGLLMVCLLALVALFIYAYLAPSNSFLLLPDKAHPLAPIVSVQNGHQDPRGGIYFLDVVEQRASILQRHFSFLRGDGELVPQQAVVPDNLSLRQSAQLDAAEMSRSKQIAEAIALEHLKYHVGVRASGMRVLVVNPGSPATGKLLAGDVIVAVDGRPALTATELSALVSHRRAGARVKLTIVRDGRRQSLALHTYSDPSSPGRSLIGVIVTQDAKIKIPLEVKINSGDVGGPSAGLAFALEITEKLGGDVDRGYRVAATGELALDGQVLPIGGVREKTIGARNSGIEVMLVPAGDNATEARRYAGNMKIIAVTSYQQALHALATLPPAK